MGALLHICSNTAQIYCSNFVNIIVYCINAYMYAYNVLLENMCNMYKIIILILI